MSRFRPAWRWKNAGACLGLGLGCAAWAGAAMAQAPAPPPANVLPPGPQAAPAPPGSSAMGNLIRLLVQEGAITQAQAEELLREAQDEAAIAARGGQAPLAGTAPPTSIRVPYIPQSVRNQIRDEVKDEVLKEARDQNWAQPNAVPEWVRRFHMYGDFRLRYESDLFDARNAFFPNYAALDAGSPFDLHNTAGTPPPILDTSVDRQRMRIRARLGIDVKIADDFDFGLRLATGNTTNPVTTNQTLGSTLNKYNFLLDQAFLEYHPAGWMKLWAGRFPNPWFSTDLVWDDDIAFDGVAAQFAGDVVNDVSLFFTAGAFPIENTAFNFPDNTTAKGKSRDKWLYGAQGGGDWRFARGFDFKLGAAYYDFSDLEGKLSSPCVANTGTDPCDTDDSKPGFLQQGNTLFGIRDLISNSTNPPLFQYYGLATPFREVNVTARLDVSRFGAAHVILDGDFVKNLAFHGSDIAANKPVNNLGPAVTTGAGAQAVTAPGPFVGGDLGYQARLTVGYPDIRERWEWNVNAAYKYLESDAVPDAFTDSDFHLGGTNAKGYTVGAGLGVAHNVNLTARWLSASEVSGAPYTVDVVLVDLNARF